MTSGTTTVTESGQRATGDRSTENAAGLSAESVVANVDFGKATATKRGRRPEWPYVPIIDHGTHTEQLRGLAYATRSEAVEMAQLTIAARRETLLRHLKEPRYRALREQYGLPRDIAKAEGK